MPPLSSLRFKKRSGALLLLPGRELLAMRVSKLTLPGAMSAHVLALTRRRERRRRRRHASDQCACQEQRRCYSSNAFHLTPPFLVLHGQRFESLSLAERGAREIAKTETFGLEQDPRRPERCAVRQWPHGRIKLETYRAGGTDPSFLDRNRGA